MHAQPFCELHFFYFICPWHYTDVCVILVFSPSFPTLRRTVFQFTLSSWTSWSCWVRQPSRPSHTTASTPPRGCTPPPTATNTHCASEAATGRSWRMRTRITSAHCTTGVRWVMQTDIWVWTRTPTHGFWRFDYVSLLQTRSGQERTVLEFDAPLSNTLPIIDVAVSDFGNGNQKFGFQVGPVCYNG